MTVADIQLYAIVRTRVRPRHRIRYIGHSRFQRGYSMVTVEVDGKEEHFGVDDPRPGRVRR